MTLKLWDKNGNAVITGLTDCFATLQSIEPLVASEFESMYDHGFVLMFPPQRVPSTHVGKPDEYLYNFQAQGLLK